MNDAITNDNVPADEEQRSHPMAVELRVCWIPQVPMEPFSYPVPDLAAAKLLVNALAQYDLFQFENNIKPDYCNAGGASWRHPKLTGGEWYDFDPEDESDCEEVEAAIAKAGGSVAAPVADRVYRFRAECQHDVDELRRLLGARLDRITIVNSPPLPDVDVELEIGLSLEELRDVMRRVDDGHVMVQTVARSEEYTGEREYKR